MKESVGRQLYIARLARGLSIDQAAEATHIRQRFLQALEADDWGSLPSPVQGRGFLRLYADSLGLDTRSLLDEVRAAAETLGIVAESSASTTSKVGAARPRKPAREANLASKQPGVFAEDLPGEIPTEAEAISFQNQPPDLAEVEAPLEAAALPEKKASETPSTVPASQPASRTPRRGSRGGAAAASPAASAPPRTATPIQYDTVARSGAHSQEIFKAIGGDLHKQREQLSLSLADVEKHTRLRTHYLNALEEGRMQDMPSLVQGRGMLANYARFLNLDSDVFLLRFADALQARREEIAQLEASQKPEKRPAPRMVRNLPLRRFLSVDLLVTSGLILVLIGFIVWGASHIFAIGALKSGSPTAPSLSTVLLGSAGTPAVAGTGAVQAPLENTLVGATPSPTSGQTRPASTQAATLPASLPTSDGNPIQVYVVAQQRAWVRINVDGKTKMNSRFSPGDSASFSAKNQIELVSGNAAALQVYFDNSDLGSLGTYAQVVDLIFSEKGMLKPTATITPSPTTTPTPGGTSAAGTKTLPGKTPLPPSPAP